MNLLYLLLLQNEFKKKTRFLDIQNIARIDLFAMNLRNDSFTVGEIRYAY
jgi:hypothetical protein